MIKDSNEAYYALKALDAAGFVARDIITKIHNTAIETVNYSFSPHCHKHPVAMACLDASMAFTDEERTGVLSVNAAEIAAIADEIAAVEKAAEEINEAIAELIERQKAAKDALISFQWMLLDCLKPMDEYHAEVAEE